VSSGVIFQPVITATPRPDGSIVHVVQEGQTLWTIAAVYGLDLAQLLSLNGLAEDSFVHPGDEVIVRPAATATPTDAPSPTVAPSAPPPTATLSSEQAAAATPDLLDQLKAVDPRDVLAGACITAWVVIVIAGIVIGARRVW
jgi:hypothetical protein